jgi:hypothetical protein
MELNGEWETCTDIAFIENHFSYSSSFFSLANISYMVVGGVHCDIYICAYNVT